MSHNQKILKAQNKVLQLEQKRKKLEASLMREKGKLKEQQRKMRTRTLIEIGGLAERAGLLGIDSDVLFAGFLQLAELCNDEPTLKALKAHGKEMRNGKA